MKAEAELQSFCVSEVHFPALGQGRTQIRPTLFGQKFFNSLGSHTVAQAGLNL